MFSDFDKVSTIRQAMPTEGLFADKEWLVSPDAFPIDARLCDQLEKLGHRLNLFNRACNELYLRSVAGKQPAWIADYLDRGKPPELVEFSRKKEFRADLPLVIRPDLVLTEEGFTIAELDTVPGGIGLTAWLNQTYASLGEDIVGGAAGMIEGFNAIAPNADILVSKEAGTYRPEMEWMARHTGQHVHAAETYTATGSQLIYRFFEQFDLANIPSVPALMAAAAAGTVQITPPLKPYIEEKMWFGLFWMQPLREFWRRELGERHFLELQKHIPYTWILDPAPIPHHAVIPGLDINRWEELGQFSQKQRDLILKISGFSELGWGSRSVVLGSDQPQGDWQATVAHALAEFQHHPYILQRFHKGRVVEHRFLNPATAAFETMRGRVRLCPYYFIIEGKAQMRGALATICPADKKLLHGMKDAVLVPTSIKG
ncbi:MAG: hypothetical protein JWL90_4476 [Chthoniobacteraceae bacterium]|nr:hypothetical protein [Chthoniobacteraceae bacterium]